MPPQLRARSSVGSEHLVYTQGVRGSNPFAPTDKSKSPAHRAGLFLYPKPSSSLGGLGYKKQSHICIANMDFCYFKMGHSGIFNSVFFSNENKNARRSLRNFFAEGHKLEFEGLTVKKRYYFR